MTSTVRIALAGVSICLLASCSGYDPTPDPSRTLESTGPARSGGTTYTPDDPADNNLINLFQYTYQQSLSDTDDQPKATNFFKAGVQLARINCGEFFTRLGELRQDMDFTQGAIAAGGAGAISIGGLAGMGASALALIGAGITVALGLTETYSNVYLFNPDTQAVQDLVTSSQNNYLLKAADKPPTDFYDAHAYIQGFQNLCEIHSVKKLVNKAILDKTLTGDTDSLDQLTQDADAGRIGAIEDKVKTSPLTNTQLAALHWYLVDRSFDSAGAEKIKENLKDLKNGPFKKDKSINPEFTAGDQTAVAGNLRQMSPGFKAALLRIIDGWKPKADPAAAVAGTESIGAAASSVNVTVPIAND